MTPPPVNPAPLEKIELIQRSLDCFTLGLIGLLPVLGIPFAVLAIAKFFQATRIARATWNPAQTFLTWGLTAAICGLVLTTVVFLAVAPAIVEHLQLAE